MSTDSTTPTAAIAAATSAATPTQHTILLSDEELARVKAALASKVSHHSKLASDAALIQTERTRHQSLHAEYQALGVRFGAI